MITDVFVDPLELDFRAAVLARAEELRLRADDELPLRDDADLRLRDDAEEVRRLDALALFGLLREADALPPEELRPFALEPLEPREAGFRCVDDRELAWAIAPP